MVTDTSYDAPKTCGTNVGCATVGDGENVSEAVTAPCFSVYAYVKVGLAKHAEVAEVATFTASPTKMVEPKAAPLTCATVGVSTVGAAHVALTVVSAVPLWPLADTNTWIAYDFESAGVNVAGFVVVDENAVDRASTEDHANLYIGANRAGHLSGSESSEKCVPEAGHAVSAHGSIGNAPPACVVAAIAAIGAAPQFRPVAPAAFTNTCSPLQELLA